MFKITFLTRKGERHQYGPILMDKDDAIAQARSLRDQGYTDVKLTGLLANLPKPHDHYVEITSKHLDQACQLHGVMTGSTLYYRIEAAMKSPSFDHTMPEPRRHTIIVRGDMRDADDLSTGELDRIRQPGDHVQIQDTIEHQAWRVAQDAYKLALVNYCGQGEISGS